MEGYSKIAHFMGKHQESAQVLRFSDINLQNILYLQAEIFGLRQELRKIEAENKHSSSEDVQNFPFDWYTLSHHKDNHRVNQQWSKCMELRHLLKEYNEAILQYHRLSQLPSPSKHDLKSFQWWLRSPGLGGVYLTGRDRDIWADGVDLVKIGDHATSNPLTSWFADSLLPIYHNALGRHFKSDQSSNPNFGSIVEYSDDGIARAANLFGTVIASVLPVVAIVVLAEVGGTGIRLGLVAAFTALFSTCLWLFSKGHLVEIFSATSAFAAVQVVFIGTNGCNCGGAG